MKQFILGGLLLCFMGTGFAEVVGEEVEYRDGDKTFKGYIAYDASVKEQRPGILVVHEWWGHNDYARMRARMLAEQGYTALAVDMYGEGKMADHPKDAGLFAGEVKKNMDVAAARFAAAEKLLQSHSSVNSSDISAIGYCFGGGIVLEMARRGMDLDAVASFHGSLGTSTPAKPGAVKAKVLVYNGAADPFVKAEDIAAFKAEMEQAGVDFSFTNYPGAKHSFTKLGADAFGKQFDLPLAYDKVADEASWSATLQALGEIYSR